MLCRKLGRRFTKMQAILFASVSSALRHPQPYQVPTWAQNTLTNHPNSGRLRLANLPTPLYRLSHPSPSPDSLFAVLEQHNVRFYIKRDDCSSGIELGGNKIRKLEFLLAEALDLGCDSVVTIGGHQSNHARATAAASRMLHLEPHLILRTKHVNGDLGMVGNLLIDRMVGSQIFTCTPGEYGRVGSTEMVKRVCEHLSTVENKKPYGIPVGGSNGIGTWGYINGVEELRQQWPSLQDDDVDAPDHVVFACGSGGTATGIGLGCALSFEGTTVWAVGVCDDPEYFYEYTAMIADEMGFVSPNNGGSSEDFMRDHMQILQGKGLGYALATPEELQFTRRFALDTGIVLDPVYSGKALYNFVEKLREDPSRFADKSVLFWHTGGALGLYDKADDLMGQIEDDSPCQRLDIYGKGKGIDISKATSD